jgi:hypothetical protein
MLPPHRGSSLSSSIDIHHFLFLFIIPHHPNTTMAYPRATIRPRRTSSKTSSLISNLTLVAFVLLAVICFLPVGNGVQAQEKENDYGVVVGIDLGTTYSCLA